MTDPSTRECDKAVVLRGDTLHSRDESVVVRIPGASESSTPVMRVNSDDEGVIRSISVVCGCGQHIQIVCEYKEPVSNGQA